MINDSDWERIRPPKTASMLQLALRLYDAGYSVIPTNEDKSPALPSWAQYQRQRPTKEQITSWWTDNPKANPAIITGRLSGVCVLDLDDKSLLATYLERYPTNVVVETAKGYHLYYKYPADRIERLPSTFPDKGVDFRADGGIIIAPGSIHVSGHVYSAIEGYRSDAPVALPQTLLDAITAPASEGLSTPTPADERWVSKLLESGSDKGSRDLDGAKLAGYFISKGLGVDIVKLLLLQSWYANTTDHSDFPPGSIDKIVTSVNRTHQRRNLEDRQKRAMTVLDGRDPSNSFVTSMSQFLNGPESVDWTIPGWLPESTTGLMVAPPGTYKTWLAISMLLSVSTCSPFLGKYPVNGDKSPVLLIQQEDGRITLRQRIKTILAQMHIDNGVKVEHSTDVKGMLNLKISGLLHPQMDVYTHNGILRFDDPEVMDLLIEQTRRRKYRLVVIDPLYIAANMEGYMSSAAQDMVILKKMRDEMGTSFMLLHHTRKSSEGMERMDAWGSQFINAWLETGIQLRPVADDPRSVRVKRHFKESGSVDASLLQFDIDTGEHKKFKVDVSDDDRGVIGTQSGNFHNLLDILKVKPRTHGELVDATGISKSTISKRLKKMVGEGVIEKLDSGKYRIV